MPDSHVIYVFLLQGPGHTYPCATTDPVLAEVARDRVSVIKTVEFNFQDLLGANSDD
jgi:hypothetical protein